MATDDLGHWEPLSPHEVGALFATFPGIWCIAGGWSLDLYAGYVSREHEDTDVLILRRDVPHLHDALPGWDLFAAQDGRLTAWLPGTSVPGEAHDIWCRQGDGPWRFQLMVIPTDGDDWIFRRDARIRGPLTSLTLERDGLPILAPEVQLLFKARLPNRPKDEADFASVAPFLTDARRAWLADAIVLLHGASHPWLAMLRSGSVTSAGET